MQIFRLAASLFLITIIYCTTTSAQQNIVYSKATEDTIQMVENNLSGHVHIQDSVNTWNITKRMKKNKVFGVSVAVVRNYKIAWAKGYGMADTALKIPVTPQTLFQAASISKSLNAVGVLKLAQDKKIDLYADINNYLHTWKFPYDSVSHGKKISVAELLSHTAGLTVHGFAGYTPGDSIPTLPEIFDGKHPANSAAVRSMMQPGLRSEYSGGGITVSQQLLMDVTKQAYDVYMQQQVLNPLGMSGSSYAQPPAKDKQKYLSAGYYSDGKEVKGKYHIYPEQAAAGLWTNPTDLAKYIIETQLSLKGKSNKVLAPAMTKLRLTPYIDSNAALGVFVQTKGMEKYFGHGGSNEGFRCQYYGSFDGGNGVVIMLNSDNGAIQEEIVNSVATVDGWKNYFNPVIKKAIAVNADVLKDYAGDYTMNGDTLTIAINDGKPSVIVNHSYGFNIYFLSADSFFAREISFDVKFEKDATGKVTNLYFKDEGGEHRAKRL